MNSCQISTRAFVTAVASALVLLTGCDAGIPFHQVSIEETRTVELSADGVDTLFAETSNGQVHIVAGPADSDVIEVVAHARAGAWSDEEATEALAAIEIQTPLWSGESASDRPDDENPDKAEADRDDGAVQRVGYDWITRKQGWSATVSFDITVPPQVAVKVKTSNGKVTANGLTAEFVVETSNGPIEVEGVQGELVAKTSNGTIDVATAAKRIELRTSNGSVDVELLRGPVGGKIRTSNGSVDVAFADGVDTELECHTSNGKVSYDDDLPLHEVEQQRRRDLSAMLGEGGAKLEITTSNGKIDLERLKRDN